MYTYNFLKRISPTDANVQRVAAVGKDFGAPEPNARIYCMCSLRTLTPTCTFHNRVYVHPYSRIHLHRLCMLVLL